MKEYAELLAAAQADPQNADFHSLRMAYARSEEYNPYARHSEAVFALRAALQAHNTQAALDACNDLFAINYLDIEAHMSADFAHTMLENTAQAAYHRAFARGLIRAIMATGDGLDVSTAFIVLDTSEEYLVLRILGMVATKQELMQHDGHWFDVQHTRPSQGDPLKLYFNIDLPYTWLQERHRLSRHDHGAHDT